jgi:hypothetical protein
MAREHAVRTGADRLGEHEVAPLQGSSRRVVWELDERPAPDRRDHVQVREEPDPVRPRVRGVPAAAREHELADRPAAEHAAGEDHVGLVDVERVRLDRGERLREGPRHLATGDPDARRRRPERGETAQVRPGQGLLDPQDVVLGESGGDGPGAHRVEGARRVARHPPALVEVDHDRHRGADGVAGRRYGSEALLEPPGIDADLDGLEPFVPEPQHGRRALPGDSSVPHDA